MAASSDDQLHSQRRLWHFAWLALAIVYALPAGWIAYNRVIDVTHKARTQLIQQYRLWELHPEYRGTAQNWTRFASRLLTDRQLMLRVRAKYAELAPQIELEYHHDLTIAQGEVIVVAVAAWALPLALLYGIGCAVARLRRRAVPAKTPPASLSDSRYRR